MGKQWTPRKKTVELQAAARPSRIRRQPVRTEPEGAGKLLWRSREWEIRMAIIGILFFALGINALVIDLIVLAGN
jgi:hypothetical protein